MLLVSKAMHFSISQSLINILISHCDPVWISNAPFEFCPRKNMTFFLPGSLHTSCFFYVGLNGHQVPCGTRRSLFSFVVVFFLAWARRFLLCAVDDTAFVFAPSGEMCSCIIMYNKSQWPVKAPSPASPCSICCVRHVT